MQEQRTESVDDSEHKAKINHKWTAHLWTITVFGIGTLMLLLVIAYLSFLWFVDERNRLWQKLILSNHTTVSVTISAVVIRKITSLQTTTIVSLLALQLLQKGFILKHIPRVSSLRYSNSGPYELSYILLRSVQSKPDLIVVFSALFCTIVALSLQFSSTLLTSDLSPAHIATLVRNDSTPVFPSQQTEETVSALFKSDTLSTGETAYPLFAESRHGPRTVAGIFDGIDDTGPVIRALVPVSVAKNRTKL